MLLEIRELTTLADIRDYLRLRYQVYMENEGYLPSNQDRIDITSYDLHSRFLGAFRENGRLVGGMRMILPDLVGPNQAVVEALCGEARDPRLRLLPRKRHHYFTEETFDLGELRRHCVSRGLPLVEFGRNVCLPEERRTGVGFSLVYAIYGLGLAMGAQVAVASGPLALKGFYARFGCNFLEAHGTARPEQVQTDLFCMVLDLNRLGAGPLPLARRAEGQLRRHGRIQLCSERCCLAEHHHQAPARRAWVRPQAPREYDWRPPEALLPLVRSQVSLVERSVGDGPLSPSAAGHNPRVRCEILRRLRQLGIEQAFLGRAESVTGLLEECWKCGIHPVVEVQTTRQAERLARQGPLTAALRLNPQAAAPLPGLPPGIEWMAILDDVSRTPPETLEVLLFRLKEASISRLLLEDSAGRAAPAGVRRLAAFVRGRLGAQHQLEWSGANDRGLAVANALAALESGVGRIHASGLGLGPRAGGTSMELLLSNLAALAGRPLSNRALDDYLQAVGRAYGVPVPARYSAVPVEVA